MTSTLSIMCEIKRTCYKLTCTQTTWTQSTFLIWPRMRSTEFIFSSIIYYIADSLNFKSLKLYDEVFVLRFSANFQLNLLHLKLCDTVFLSHRNLQFTYSPGIRRSQKTSFFREILKFTDAFLRLWNNLPGLSMGIYMKGWTLTWDDNKWL